MTDLPIEAVCRACRHKVYLVPAFDGDLESGHTVPFDRLKPPFKVHPCGTLPEIWGYRIRHLEEARQKLRLPRPHRLIVIACSRWVRGPKEDPLFLVAAVKVLSSSRLCAFFRGGEQPPPGYLAVLGGLDEKRCLLFASDKGVHILRYDGEGHPGNLGLPARWLSGS